MFDPLDPMPEERLERVRKLAEAATPGPYGYVRGRARPVTLLREHSSLGSRATGRGMALVFDAEPGNNTDAAFFAELDPAFVLALLDRNRALSQVVISELNPETAGAYVKRLVELERIALRAQSVLEHVPCLCSAQPPQCDRCKLREKIADLDW